MLKLIKTMVVLHVLEGKTVPTLHALHGLPDRPIACRGWRCRGRQVQRTAGALVAGAGPAALCYRNRRVFSVEDVGAAAAMPLWEAVDVVHDVRC